MADSWYTVKVSVVRPDARGKLRKRNEDYLVEALSCTEAEARTVKELEGQQDVEVTATLPARVTEVLTSPERALLFWRVSTEFAQINARGRESRSVEQSIIQADDFDMAVKEYGRSMESIMADWRLLGLVVTRYADVLRPIVKS